MEHEGEYWGKPADDAQAIGEVERLRQQGAKFLVIGWPAFWWLSYYSRFSEYLKLKFRCVVGDERVMVFDLRNELDEK
jgi:hypothetical protein